jgi:hypothetical protein
MHIGIISDTHNRLARTEAAVELLRSEGAETLKLMAGRGHRPQRITQPPAKGCEDNWDVGTGARQSGQQSVQE